MTEGQGAHQEVTEARASSSVSPTAATAKAARRDGVGAKGVLARALVGVHQGPRQAPGFLFLSGAWRGCALTFPRTLGATV
jgi:hypothetical protein